MFRDHTRTAALIVAAGLLVAACGGSDDEPAADEPAAESAGTDEPADETSDETSDGTSDVASDEAMDEPDDGSGTNDDAQQSLDDAGVDMDLDELEEDIGALSTGDGGGVVTIDGTAYTFEATGVCISQGDDFVAEGLGQDPEGNPAWVSISASMEDFDGDGTEGPSIDVFVEPGRLELFGEGPDDAPDFSASYWEGFGDASQEIVYELDGGSISGSGPVQDFNGVAWPFGESREMSFEASCG